MVSVGNGGASVGVAAVRTAMWEIPWAFMLSACSAIVVRWSDQFVCYVSATAIFSQKPLGIQG